MSKQTEALKLALEALELYQSKSSVQMFDDAVKALREALAEQSANVATVNTLEELVDKTAENVHEQPAQDNTYSYAKNLAEAIFKQHFASDEHYASGQIVWGVNDTVIGILTQIDNMVTDMVRRPAQQQEPVAGKPLPCPFCGHKGLDFDEGSTYRWGVASCSGCGASCGEIRREYPDQGQWHTEAIAEWNRRTPQPASKPLTDEQFLELILRNGTVELVGACTFVGGSIQMQGKMGLLRSAKIIKEFVEAAHGITGEPND